MKDFKFLTAVAAEKCAMCHDPIIQGKGFYWEATEKKPYCCICGREIRAKGFDEAMKGRNVFMKMAREMMGDFGKGL